MSMAGLQAAQQLKRESPDIRLSVTAVASAWQAFLCGKAGVDIVSLFNGPVDTVNGNPVEMVAPVRRIYENYGCTTRILSCGRFPRSVADFAVAGSHICTMGIEFWRMLCEHPHTYQRMMGFMEDWTRAFGDATWPLDA